MKVKILILCILIVGCIYKNQSTSTNIYQQFQELFKVDEKLLVSSNLNDIASYEDDKKLRDTIFSKISNTIINTQKLLFLRKIFVLSDMQTGLVYVKSNDTTDERVFYFKKTKNSPVIVGEGTNDYSDLTKVLTILKNDFYGKSQKLKEYFEKRSLGDVPSLQIAFVDCSNTKVTKGIVHFNFSHLDNLFEETFSIKEQSVK